MCGWCKGQWRWPRATLHTNTTRRGITAGRFLTFNLSPFFYAVLLTTATAIKIQMVESAAYLIHCFSAKRQPGSKKGHHLVCLSGLPALLLENAMVIVLGTWFSTLSSPTTIIIALILLVPSLSSTASYPITINNSLGLNLCPFITSSPRFIGP